MRSIERRPQANPSAWLGLLLLTLYMLCAGGQPFISDGEVMLITAMRLVDERTVSLPEGAAIYPQTVRRADGYLFSKYGLGQPLAAAPLYAFGRYVLGQRVVGAAEPFYVGRFVALLLPAFATALTGALLCAWAGRLYRSARIGLALGLLYGVGTLAWPYSRFFFSEPLFTAALVLSALMIARGRPLLAGLAFGYALLTRVGGLVLLPAFGIYLWLAADDRPPTTDDSLRAGARRSVVGRRLPIVIRQLLWFGLGIVPFALAMIGYNWVRFRSLAERGYAGEGFTGNLLEGLYGLLLSPGKSVFLYVPLLLALPWAVRPFARRFPAEAALAGMLAAITLVQSALWWIWWAGWGWGPRFLVPLMPFAVLMLGVLVEPKTESQEPAANAPVSNYSSRFSALSFRLVALLTLSVGVNLLGILVDFNPYIAELTGGEMSRESIYLYQPAHSPIMAHLARLGQTRPPIVGFTLGDPLVGIAQPWAGTIALALAALLLVAGARVWRMARQYPTPSPSPTRGGET